MLLRAFNRSNRSGNEPLPPQQKKLVVALQLEDFDQQLQSPLYDGKFPPEIRKLIFDFALTEYVDSESFYPTNADYTRPNFLGKKRVCINPLLLCKRSYLETRHLPPTKKTHAFWHGCGPPGERYRGDELGYFCRFEPAQLALVKEIHLFTQQWWLEWQFADVCTFDVLQGIEKVKITIRRGDWCRINAPLAISPQRPEANVRLMKEDWRREKAGEIVKWDENSWGSAFRRLKGLKELEMEFETYDYKEKELDEIISHAVMWKFPMGDGKVLSAEGLGGAKRGSWRGPPSGWSECPSCIGQAEDSEEDWEEDWEDCRFCEEMKNLKRRPGPMLIIRTLRWKLADAN